MRIFLGLNCEIITSLSGVIYRETTRADRKRFLMRGYRSRPVILYTPSLKSKQVHPRFSSRYIAMFQGPNNNNCVVNNGMSSLFLFFCSPAAPAPALSFGLLDFIMYKSIPSSSLLFFCTPKNV